EETHGVRSVIVADGVEIHLQRRALEAADLAVVLVGLLDDVGRRADPRSTRGALALEGLAAQPLDDLVVAGIIRRGPAGGPIGSRLQERAEIPVERLARDRGGLFAALVAEHVEGQHDAAFALVST